MNRLFLAVTLGLLMFAAVDANAAWLTGWNKRKSITIAGSADGDQTDYQVRITANYGSGTDTGSTVYLGGQVKTDFADLRFTASDGTTTLSHYVVRKTDSNNAIVDVKIPSILAASGASIYLYYDNGSAASASNGPATYPMFHNSERAFGGPIFANAATKLLLNDTQGGYQTAHPSVYKFASPWNGHKYWMVNTPYPAGNDDYENPCIYYSDDETNWTAIAGNPVVGKATPAAAYNADTEIVYNDSTNELWVYYKHYNGTVFSMRVIKSSNGTTWTDLAGAALNPDTNPGTLALDLSAGEEVSYAVQKLGASSWVMWSIRFSDKVVLKRTSSDGVSWSTSTSCVFKNRHATTKTWTPWHFQAKYIADKNKYIGMFNTGQPGFNRFVMLAESTDGTTFTVYPVRALEPAPGSWDASDIYRPSFIYDPSDNKIKVWYSAVDLQGASPDIWATGYTERDYDVMRTAAGDLDGWDEDFYNSLTDCQLRSSTAQARTGTRSTQVAGVFDAFKAVGLSGKLKVNVSLYDDGTTAKQIMLQVKDATTKNFGVGWMATTNIIAYNNGSSNVIAARSAGWHDFEMRFNGTAVAVYMDGSFVNNYTAAMATHTQAKIYSSTTGGAGVSYLDDLYTRNYTPNEPTVTTMGVEENAPPTGDPQTITFAPLTAKTYTDAPFTLTATATSGLAVSYSSSNTSVATVSGSTATITGVGTTNITASQAGDGTWAAATPVVQTLTVNKADQTISVSGLGTKLKTADPFAISATASSGLAVVLSILSGPATIDGSTVTLTGDTGTVTVRATQAGNGNYNAATGDNAFNVVDKLLKKAASGFSFSNGSFGFNF